MEIKYRSIPGNTLLASNEKLLAECMELYSNHYGMWSKAGPHPGNHVKLSKERFLPWLQAESATLYYATLGEKVIGYAVAIRVKSKDFGTISWVTQLVVHSDYRNKGIAKNILFSIWCFSSDTAWGIVSSNPYAIRALEKATRRRAIPSRIKRNSKRLKNIGKEYVPYIDDDSEIEICDTTSAINTNFFVDHQEIPEKIKNVSSENTPWLLGQLKEGWEWFAFTFKDQDQISLSKEEIADMISISDSVAQKAYENMILEKYLQRWMSHTESEIEYVLNNIQISKTSIIYDFGCGIGRHSIELAKRGYACIGIDYINKNIDEANKKKEGLHLENVDFLCADCRSFQGTQLAEMVLCLYDVIGSFADFSENERIVKNIYSLLKTGGYAVISVMNYESTLYHAKKTFDFDSSPNELLQLPASNIMETTGDVFNPDFYLVDTKTHLVYRKEQFSPTQQLPMELVIRDRRYSMEEITKLVQETGFDIVKKDYVNASDWNISYPATSKKQKKYCLFARKNSIIGNAQVRF